MLSRTSSRAEKHSATLPVAVNLCRWQHTAETFQTLVCTWTESGAKLTQADPRMGGPSRHHSVGEFGDVRSHSGSNLQNFYANQRQGPPRASEAEQVMQAKRRMAAQRERELRNYHQEQQYNRSRPPSSLSS